MNQSNQDAPPRKPGDEIIEIPNLPDAELQCIACLVQVLDLFLPLNRPELTGPRGRVLNYCVSRYGMSYSFMPGGPGAASPLEALGFSPEQTKKFVKDLRKTAEEIDREGLIPGEDDLPGGSA